MGNQTKKTLYIKRIVAIGGILAVGVAGGVMGVREWVEPEGEGDGAYDVATELKPASKSVPFLIPLNVQCSGSGGNLVDDYCIVKNPLKSMSGSFAGNSGTGVIVAGWLELGNNPTEASFDVCFVLAPRTDSGAINLGCPISNSKTGTGSVTAFNTGSTIMWNGDHYLAVKTDVAQTGSGTARLRILLHDTFGE